MYIKTSSHEILNVIEKKVSNFLGGFWYVCKNHNPKEIHSDFVIKEADTIEELCDQIVCDGILYQNKIIRNGCCWLVEDNFEELEEPVTGGMIEDGIYGAIWTEWGLKYVAKMNDRGELELI